MKNLKKFQSNKVVSAVKIKQVLGNMKGGAKLTPEGKKPEDFTVSHNFMTQHNPKAGDYFTKDDKGTISVIGQKEFEADYSEVKKTAKKQEPITEDTSE